MRLALLALLVLTARLSAQTEDQLRRFFEGKTVIVKLDMPGSDDGVDVYPGTSMPVDFPRHATRLKRYGTAVRRGDESLVTKIRVKSDLIEFQLGGGGYGTFGDDASSYISTESVPKTVREKNLERDLSGTTDPVQKRKIREELDALRRDREREDGRRRAEATQAQQIKEANIRQRRVEGGSRFNLRYKPAVPAEGMTPEGVMQALAEYVDFAPLLGNRPDPRGEGNRPPGSPGELRKGMSADEVDALLGRPSTIAQRMEGTLKVSASVYETPTHRIEAEFVEGVLVRFVTRSR
ncbi:MAG: hypothetical protein ABI647_14915 [Gemmatimonadota bacterium]